MVALGALARKLFGSTNERHLKAYKNRVEAINALEGEISALTDEALRNRTIELRAQFENGAKLDTLLVPAFATVREAAKRTLGQRHFDVQLIGGMVLHENSIAEMKTGEGKTLVATLPVYLNALTSRGVHVVTVNDYLAKRDAGWMGQIYEFLGLTTGVIVHGIDDAGRKAAYAADVTYGTNNEFGFDYLRDNMKSNIDHMVQRDHYYAIVDEVDSILIDEARTPLIISGPLEDKSELYNHIDTIIPKLDDDDFEIDEKNRSATFTEKGTEKLEDTLQQSNLLKGNTLYDVENVTIVHHLNQALKAHKLFIRDRDYIVRGQDVVIIDEFTGRMMPGRRFGEGLHQALEAKEKVAIQPENQTLASITFQNYFRMYEKLAGMTGTAATEAEEFSDIYGLGVVEVPTNKPITRIDEDDEVYRTAEEKYRAIIREIIEARKRNQPVLVGTTSIEKSELLAEQLRKQKIKNFQVLNARYHEQEALIVAQAGVPGTITIATNMAGRGTDIQLGGNLDMRINEELKGLSDSQKRDEAIAKIANEVEDKKQQALESGGLYVIGTERHESRRIDNQLRGRSGRQGDPGRSKFFLSLEDDLMRIFGSDRMGGMLQKLGLKEDEAIVHPWINKALEKAQKKVEARNFDIRKNILKFDDVMNDQRKVIFEQRLDLMREKDLSSTVTDMRHETIEDLVAHHIPEKAYAEQWDGPGLKSAIKDKLNCELPIEKWVEEDGIAEQEILARIIRHADEAYAAKTVRFTTDIMRQVEKAVVLQTLDHSWREHLLHLEHLRQVIGFRGYGQRDPLNEYKTESFELFQSLLISLRETVTVQLSHIELSREIPDTSEDFDDNQLEEHRPDPITGEDVINNTSEKSAKLLNKKDPNDPKSWGKVRRNELCPCGSGKKYKHCHGQFN